MSPVDILSPAGQAASSPSSTERVDADLFAGMLAGGTGERPSGRLGLGRQLRAQEAAIEAGRSDQDAASLAGGLLVAPTDRPLINPGLNAAKEAGPQINPGESQAKPLGPQINPGEAQTKPLGPQINPGEPQTKSVGPQINPGEPVTKPVGPEINPGLPGSGQAGGTVAPGQPGVLDMALQALSAQDQANAVNTLAQAARQAVGRAPESGLTPAQTNTELAADAVAPALDAEALVTADGQSPTVASASPGASGASATGVQTGAASDPSVQAPATREARPELDLARFDDAGPDLQDPTLEAVARPVASDAATPIAAARADVPVARLGMDAVAQLSAQIIRRLEGRTTRFDIELNPVELGRVDVRLDIDAEGRLAARLAFDNPAAAVELRGRVDELRRDLQQAGFQLADDAFSFADRGGSGRDQAGHGDNGRGVHARSAEIAAEIDAAAQPALRTMTRLGLDVRV